jgi:hypothetical protein
MAIRPTQPDKTIKETIAIQLTAKVVMGLALAIGSATASGTILSKILTQELETVMLNWGKVLGGSSISRGFHEFDFDGLVFAHELSLSASSIFLILVVEHELKLGFSLLSGLFLVSPLQSLL